MRLRLVTAVLGMLLALAAIARNDKRLAWAAIAVLLVAFVLRLIARRKRDAELDR